MNNKGDFMKLSTRIASTLALTAVASSAAVADTFQAAVTVLDTLAIAENTAVDFGTVTSTDGTCIMATGGALSGTNGCTGTATPGAFTITGSDVTVDLTVTAGAAVDGVTFAPAIDGSSSPTLSGGTTSVAVIGQLTLASATAGAKSIDFDLTANYQ